MPGARCTRGLACKMHKRKRTRAYRFSGGNPTFPAQWFTAYTVLSPVIGFLATVACERFCKLDAGVEASGPHVFAVRVGALVRSTSASTASRSAFVTFAKRPSEGTG
jgi:hypothetical protein